MDFEEVKVRMTGFIRDTGIAPSDIAIGAGVALMYHGLRESAIDIDISVSIEAFEALRKEKGVEEGVMIVPWDDVIDVHVRENMVGESIPTMWGCFYNLSELIEQKVKLLLLRTRSAEKHAQDAVDLRAINVKLREMAKLHLVE